MAAVFLLSVDNLKQNTYLDSNIQDKDLKIAILNCQEQMIEPEIGTKLYNKLLTGIADGQLELAYQNLIVQYIWPVLRKGAVYMAAKNLLYRYTNSSVVADSNQNSTAIARNDLEKLRDDEYEGYLHHLKTLQLFLTANSATYPEYWQAGTTDLPAAPTQSPMFFYYEDDVPPGYGPRGIRRDHGVEGGFDDHTSSGLALPDLILCEFIDPPEVEQGRTFGQDETAMDQGPGPGVCLPLGMSVHHVGHERAHHSVIEDDKLEPDEKRKPILVQHDDGHHHKKMKVQFDLTPGEVYQEGRSCHEPAGGDGRLETAADNGKPCGDGDEGKEPSSPEIEGGTCPHVDTEHRHAQHVEPEYRKNSPVTGVPCRFGQ